MAHELSLHLDAGMVLHLRALPNGLDVTVLACKHLQQRVVYGAIVGADTVRVEDGNRLLFGITAFVPVTPAEATVVVAFAALAKVSA